MTNHEFINKRFCCFLISYSFKLNHFEGMLLSFLYQSVFKIVGDSVSARTKVAFARMDNCTTLGASLKCFNYGFFYAAMTFCVILPRFKPFCTFQDNPLFLGQSDLLIYHLLKCRVCSRFRHLVFMQVQPLCNLIIYDRGLFWKCCLFFFDHLLITRLQLSWAFRGSPYSSRN